MFRNEGLALWLALVELTVNWGSGLVWALVVRKLRGKTSGLRGEGDVEERYCL